MITPAYAQTMAAYNGELNTRLYGAAGRLTDEERRRDRGAFWRSIHGTLSHVVWADRMWLSRFEGGDKPPQPLAESGELFADFEAMTRAREAEDARIKAWSAQLAGDWLAGDLTWTSGAVGREIVMPRAVLVMHFFNHQTHHRGQAHAMITGAGEKTGATDLPFVLM